MNNKPEGKGLDELDWISNWRKVMIWKAGQGKRIKQRMNRRFRRKDNQYVTNMI